MALGAVASHAVIGKKLGGKALIIGAMGGLMPDLDVFIGSKSDPLSHMVYHRHFTHSLSFMPIGGAITSLLFFKWWGRNRSNLLNVYWAALVGYATHAPLDICTSWGTQFLLPFSNRRLSLDIVSIIDPIYTLMLLIGIGLVLYKRSQARGLAKISALALLFSTLYLGFGGFQHYRALGLQEELAKSRGHHVERRRAMPGFGNNVVWSSVYIAGEKIYFDSFRIPWWSGAGFKVGSSVVLFDQSQLNLPPGISRERRERILKDFDRWKWFSDGFISRVQSLETKPTQIMIGDYRYSGGGDHEIPSRALLLDWDESAPSTTRWAGLGGSRFRKVRILESWKSLTGHGFQALD